MKGFSLKSSAKTITNNINVITDQSKYFSNFFIFIFERMAFRFNYNLFLEKEVRLSPPFLFNCFFTYASFSVSFLAFDSLFSFS